MLTIPYKLYFSYKSIFSFRKLHPKYYFIYKFLVHNFGQVNDIKQSGV